jgi:hypothetical protein
MTAPLNMSLRYGNPDFLDLPWDLPVSQWQGRCDRLEELPRGLSRHPVVFVNYDSRLFAIKELSQELAELEYNLLLRIEEQRLPSVTPVGHLKTLLPGDRQASVLITSYLDHSLPYRSLFMHTSQESYRKHLLDAIASLLVQLHLAGVYWGDCSLSNTLFRRDAGYLQAYLVDAETAEFNPQGLPPADRHQDLVIMEENINGDLAELETVGLLSVSQISEGVPLGDTGAYIRLRYQQLWEEITREVVITANEHYRIQERIRAMNDLGFSVGEVELAGAEGGSQLHLRVVVTDRNFHRNQLFGLTGLEAEDKQAVKMMNEIQELKATLSQADNRSTPLSVAAYHWMEHIYRPTIAQLGQLVTSHMSPAELYCQVLENKWYLSEKAQRDVGHQAATQDYIQSFSKT